MLIGPDWCSVRTVKLLTVNKFKIDSLEVSFFVKVWKLSQNVKLILQKNAFKLFLWMASFLESLPYHGSFCIQNLTILTIMLLIIS